MDYELTIEEQVYYSTYANIEICDLCGGYYGFLNLYDGYPFIQHTDRQLLCNKCRFNAL